MKSPLDLIQSQTTQIIKWSMRVVCLILMLGSLVGCATTAKYRANLYQWHGRSVKALVAVWGYPDNIIHSPEGNKVYVYFRSSIQTVPAMASGGTTYISTENNRTVVMQSPMMFSGGQSYQLNCNTWFELNKKGVIISTRFRGNDCVAS